MLLKHVSSDSSMNGNETMRAQLQLHLHLAFPCPSSSVCLQETCSWTHDHYQDKCVPHMESLRLSAFPPMPWQPEKSIFKWTWVFLEAQEEHFHYQRHLKSNHIHKTWQKFAWWGHCPWYPNNLILEKGFPNHPAHWSHKNSAAPKPKYLEVFL